MFVGNKEGLFVVASYIKTLFISLLGKLNLNILENVQSIELNILNTFYTK